MSSRRVRRAVAVGGAVVVVMALAPLLAGCSEVVVVAVAGAVLGGRASEPAPPLPPESEERADNDLNVTYLKAGDCFDEPGEGGAANPDGGEIQSVLLIPCDDPHTFEVYVEADLGMTHFPSEMSPTGEYPGDEEIFGAADEYCYGAFEDFVGEAWENSPLEYWFYTPLEESWSHGDRIVTCFIGEPGVTVTGSAEGSGRRSS